MSAPRFYIGELDTITFTMSEAESGSFPLAHLKTYFADYKWRSTNKAINQTLKLDLGSSKEIDFVIIEGHNFSTVGADAVKLQAADDAAFTSGLVTLTSALATLGSPGKIEFTSQTKRYVRILFEKAAGSLAEIPELGQIFVNKKISLQSFDYPHKSGNGAFETFIKHAVNGLELAHQNYGGRTVFEFRFSKQSDAFKTTWVDMHNAVRGKLYPFYFYDPADASWYVCLSEDYNPMLTVAANNHETNVIAIRTRGSFLRAPGGGFGKRFGKQFGKRL